MKRDPRVTARSTAPALALALLAATGSAQIARAEATVANGSPRPTRRIVAILDVQGPTPEMARNFERDIESQLDTSHYWLVSRASLRSRLAASTKWAEGCVVGKCLHEVKVQTGAEVVLLAALTGSGTSFGYVVTLARTDTGRVLAQESDRCDVCTMNEAMGAATLASVKLVSSLPDVLPDEAAAQGAAIDLAVGAVQRKLVAEQRHGRRVGLALTLVGLAAAAAGTAAYFLQDERPSYGLAAAAAGGGLTLGGVVVLTF